MNRLRQTLPALRHAASGRAGRVRNMSGHGSAEENAAEMERWKNITYVAVPAVFLLTAYTLSTASHHHDDEKIVRACVWPGGAAAAWNVVGWAACFFTLGGLTFLTLLRPLFVCAGLRLHAHSKQAVAVGRCEHAAPVCLACVKALLTRALCTPASFAQGTSASSSAHTRSTTTRWLLDFVPKEKADPVTRCKANNPCHVTHFVLLSTQITRERRRPYAIHPVCE